MIGAKPATCTKEGNNKYYQCRVCSAYFTDKEGTVETTKEAQKIPKLDHVAESISAVSNIENPMATMVVKPSNITVTAVCSLCGESFEITEDIQLEGATTLALGVNEITVKHGDLSTTLTIEAAALDVTLEGKIKDDTYVASGNKDTEYSSKTTLSTYSSSFRAYLRVNVSDILANELFKANEEKAKAQLVLAVAEGSASGTNLTLKAYAPAAGVTDVDFALLTWNSVASSGGTYSQLHWSKGTAVSCTVSADGGYITVTLPYSEIGNYADAAGNILFAFATNTSELKVASKENAAAPSFKVILKDGQ